MTLSEYSCVIKWLQKTLVVGFYQQCFTLTTLVLSFSMPSRLTFACSTYSTIQTKYGHLIAFRNYSTKEKKKQNLSFKKQFSDSGLFQFWLFQLQSFQYCKYCSLSKTLVTVTFTKGYMIFEFCHSFTSNKASEIYCQNKQKSFSTENLPIFSQKDLNPCFLPPRTLAQIPNQLTEEGGSRYFYFSYSTCSPVNCQILLWFREQNNA